MFEEKFKFLLIALAVVGLSVLLGACGGGDSSSSSSSEGSSASTETEEGEATPTAERPANFPNFESARPKGLKSGKGIKVAIVMSALEVASQKSLLEAMEETGKKLGVTEQTYVAKGLADVESQVTAMENAIAGNPDAIVLFPGTPTGLNSQIQEARNKGIKVVTDLLPSEQEVDLFIGSTIQDQAKLAAEEVAKELNGKGKVWLVLGPAGTVLVPFYEEAIEEVFESHPGLEITYKKTVSELTAAEGQKVAEAGITSEPDVGAVMTDAEAVSEGVHTVLSAAGGADTLITGTGANNRAQLNLIKEGVWANTIAPFVAGGEIGMEWAVALVQGQKAPGPEINLPPAMFNSENIEAAVNSGAIFEFMSANALGCGGPDAEPCF